MSLSPLLPADKPLSRAGPGHYRIHSLQSQRLYLIAAGDNHGSVLANGRLECAQVAEFESLIAQQQAETESREVVCHCPLLSTKISFLGLPDWALQQNRSSYLGNISARTVLSLSSRSPVQTMRGRISFVASLGEVEREYTF
jgi:hypothetical protein